MLRRRRQPDRGRRRSLGVLEAASTRVRGRQRVKGIEVCATGQIDRARCERGRSSGVPDRRIRRRAQHPRKPGEAGHPIGPPVQRPRVLVGGCAPLVIDAAKFADVEMRLGVRRSQANRFGKLVGCAATIAVGQQHASQIVVRLGVRGVEPKRGFVFSPRLCEATSADVHVPEVDVCRRVRRVECRGFRVARLRLERGAQVENGDGGRRLEPHDRLEVIDRALEFPDLEIQQGDVRVKRRVGGILPNARLVPDDVLLVRLPPKARGKPPAVHLIARQHLNPDVGRFI